jgi:hypothetical protein
MSSVVPIPDHFFELKEVLKDASSVSIGDKGV